MALGTFSGSGLGFGLVFSLVDDFSHTARRIERQMVALGGAASSMAASVERSMAMVRTGVGLLIGSLISLAFWVKSAKVSAEFERYKSGFQAFVGSAVKAEEIFRNITQDAIDNPFFQIDTMQKANLMLIAQGEAAEDARRIIRNLGIAIAGVGGGDAEMMRAVVALEKMKAAGHMDYRHWLSFTHARLPIDRMLQNTFGITYASAKKAGKQITIEMIDGALQAAVAKGGIFGGVEGIIFKTTYAKMQQLKEMVKVTFGNIGDAIHSTTASVLDRLKNLFTSISNFVQTPLGGWFARAAFNLTLFAGALGLLLILVSANKLMLGSFASVLGASAKVSVMHTLATRGLAAAYGQLFLQFIRNIPMLLTMAAPLIAIAGAVYLVAKSFMRFKSFMEGTGNGRITFLEKLGGVLTWIITLFGSYNDVTKSFDVSPKLIAAMDALGLGEFARNSATWVSRIMEFWNGLKEGISNAWGEIRAILKGFLESIGLGSLLIDKNTSALETWRAVGDRVGRTLMAIVVGWTILKALQIVGWGIQTSIMIVQMGYQLAILATRLITQIVLWGVLNAEMLVYNAVGLATMVIIGLIIYGLSQLGGTHEETFKGMKYDLNGYTSGLMNIGNEMGGYGAGWANDIRTGWQGGLEGWNPLKPLTDAWAQFKQDFDDWMYKIGHLGGDRGSKWAGFQDWISGYSDWEGNARPDIVENFRKSVGRSTQIDLKPFYQLPEKPVYDKFPSWMLGPQAQMTPVTNNPAPAMPPINIQLMLDGKQIANQVIDTALYEKYLGHH